MSKNNDLIKPDFIGVGAMKCATTWISECLRYHPEVFMSTPKEIHFFTNNYEKGLEWYLKYFKNSQNYRTRGEFSASYLFNNKVPIRIKNDIGEVKILVSIRNPVERFISQYKHYLRKGKANGNLTIENYKKAIKNHPNLLHRGNYAKHLKRYINVFGIKNIKIIIKEDIDNKPKKVLEEIYSFLDVDPHFVPSIVEKKVSPGIVPRVMLLENIRKKTFKWSKRNAPWIINFVKKFRLSELYRKINGKKELFIDPQVYDELYNYYENKIIATEELINKDLSLWES